MHPPILQEIPALASLASLDVEAAGLRWLSPEAGRASGEKLGESYEEEMPMGTLWPGDTWDVASEKAQGKVQVLEGPVFHAGTRDESQGVWFLDLSSPDRLYFAPSSAVAPLLWAEVPLDPKAVLAEAQRAVACASRGAEASYEHHLRAAMGRECQVQVPDVYSGELIEADPAALTNYWVCNPYRSSLPSADGQTLFSRSLARCEFHPVLGMYVWDIHYDSAGHPEQIQELNELLGLVDRPLDLPLDLPLDVAGCIQGFEFLSRARVEQLLADAVDAHDDATIASCIEHLAALRYEDPELPTFLAPFAKHKAPDVRWAVGFAYYSCGLRDLFLALRAQETDPDVRGRLPPDPPDEIPDGPVVIPHAFG